ncbi:MAG: DUF3108 domain-containing protein [Gammaproteobacteria bacterium]|nr:DUF3108 domain-containing protein [Gammaproteobacteria bacterium]
MLLLLPATTLWALEPQPYHSVYEVSVAGLSIGAMERQLERLAEGEFRLKTKIYITGFMANFRDDRMEEESRWRWNEKTEQQQPLAYRYTKRGGSKEKQRSVDFDYVKGVAISRDQAEVTELKLPDPATTIHDKLSYQWLLRHELAQRKREFVYQLVDGDALREYQFRVVGKVVLSTPAGKFDTLEVERINADGRKISFWCALDHDFQLVKIIQDDGRQEITAVISELNRTTPPPAATSKK